MATRPMISSAMVRSSTLPKMEVDVELGVATTSTVGMLSPALLTAET